VTHLLDTNACVNHLRYGEGSNIRARLSTAVPGSVVLCSVVLAELPYGAHRSARRTQTLTQVHDFCHQLQSLPFDDRAAAEYGRIRALLTGLGTSIGPNDMMIASIALANGLTVAPAPWRTPAATNGHTTFAGKALSSSAERRSAALAVRPAGGSRPTNVRTAQRRVPATLTGRRKLSQRRNAAKHGRVGHRYGRFGLGGKRLCDLT
jgi:tRNA(fMet)-specific endonuclease VapC